jgi:hypothetical protein
MRRKRQYVMTVRNNDMLFNAAQVGFMAAMYFGTFPVGVTTAQTTNLLAASLVFAVAVDTAIPNDAGGALPVSVVTTGVPIAPTTGAIIGAQAAKSYLLAAICQAVMSGRPTQDVTAADYSTIATAIAVIYQASIANLQVT